MDQTGTTYPETYVREMSGDEIKLILEDVMDNLFNQDPYYQQGGDMVRVGGMDYVCDPTAEMGKRVLDMALDDGTPIEPNKKYKVAGGDTVGENPAQRLPNVFEGQELGAFHPARLFLGRSCVPLGQDIEDVTPLLHPVRIGDSPLVQGFSAHLGHVTSGGLLQ